MATQNSVNYNDDEFSDLDPVLDEDSFSLDTAWNQEDSLELEEDLESFIASPTEEEWETSTENAATTDTTNLNDDWDFSIDESNTPEETQKESDNSSIELDDLNLDLDIEEDPLLDEKINEIVEEEEFHPSDLNDADSLVNEQDWEPADKELEARESEDSLEGSDDFLFDDLEVENEPITLSMEELENITSSAEESSISPQAQDIESLSLSPTTTETSLEEEAVGFTDEELDEILGKDDLDEGEIDYSDEPISLSMEELDNIMSDQEPESFTTLEPIEHKEEEASSHIESESDFDFDLNLEDEKVSTEEVLEPISTLDDNEPQELFGEEDIADEPITLSLDELNAITGESEDVAKETVKAEEDWDTFSETKTNESMDSLSLDSEIPFEESQEVSADVLSLPESDGTVDFEEFSLGDEDLSSEDTHKLESFDDSSIGDTHTMESTEEESLALSDEELSNILASNEDEPSTESIAEDTGINVTLEDEDFSNEPITLSSDELNNILGEIPEGEDLIESGTLLNEDVLTAQPESDEILEESLPSSDFDMDEISELQEPKQEETTELDGAAVGIEEEKSHESKNVITDLKPSIQLIQVDESQIIDLDEYAPEGELSPKDELRQNLDTPEVTVDKSSESELKASELEKGKEEFGQELSKEELKKVLSYLDNLLGNLPDDLIREFSKSSYFELYKKLMKEIGL